MCVKSLPHNLLLVDKLAQMNPEVVRRWVSEAQTVTESRFGLVLYHAISLLIAIKSNDKLGMSKLLSKMSSVGFCV